MNTGTVETMVLVALAIAPIIIFLFSIGMYLYNIFQEVSDESAEHSRARREEYASARLRIVLTGFVIFLGFVGFTVVLTMMI